MVSPLLANIVLHYVLDEWFAKEVRPRLKGEAFLIRYADDFVIGVAREDDARRIMEVLPKRMSKYGLTVHPEKTRVVRFHPADVADSEPADQNSTGPRTFDFLGFTHYWGRSLKGGWVVKRKTAKSRLKRALHSLSDWCRQHLHQPIAVQHQTLKQMLQGHYAYYGITGNFPSLQEFLEEARKIWRHWLSRRRRDGEIPWSDFLRLEQRYGLPRPRVVHSLLCSAANPVYPAAPQPDQSTRDQAKDVEVEEETPRASASSALDESLSRHSGYDSLNGIGLNPAKLSQV